MKLTLASAGTLAKPAPGTLGYSIYGPQDPRNRRPLQQIVLIDDLAPPLFVHSGTYNLILVIDYYQQKIKYADAPGLVSSYTTIQRSYAAQAIIEILNKATKDDLIVIITREDCFHAVPERVRSRLQQLGADLLFNLARGCPGLFCCQVNGDSRTGTKICEKIGSRGSDIISETCFIDSPEERAAKIKAAEEAANAKRIAEEREKILAALNAKKDAEQRANQLEVEKLTAQQALVEQQLLKVRMQLSRQKELLTATLQATTEAIALLNELNSDNSPEIKTLAQELARINAYLN